MLAVGQDERRFRLVENIHVASPGIRIVQGHIEAARF